MKNPLDNIGIKIFSVILAITLWFFVSSQERSEVGFSVPIQFKKIPDSLEILRVSAEYLNVRISGPGAIIKSITPQQVQLSIDLENAKEGQTYYHISQNDISLPKGVEASRISPNDITIEMERSLRKKVVITPVFAGKINPDFKIDKVELNTKYLEIAGPKSLIELINQVETNPIDLSSIIKDTEKEITLKPLTDPVRILQKNPIYITIFVKPNLISKILEDVPVVPKGAKGIKIEPEKISVTVEGVTSKVANLSPGDIKVTLDIPAEQRGSTLQLKPRVALPADLNLVKIHPETIAVDSIVTDR